MDTDTDLGLDLWMGSFVYAYAYVDGALYMYAYAYVYVDVDVDGALAGDISIPNLTCETESPEDDAAAWQSTVGRGPHSEAHPRTRFDPHLRTHPEHIWNTT